MDAEVMEVVSRCVVELYPVSQIIFNHRAFGASDSSISLEGKM